MDTVDNPYKYRSRFNVSPGGKETVAVSALHEDPLNDTGAVAKIKGGEVGHEGKTQRKRLYSHTDKNGKDHNDWYGDPEMIWVDEDTKNKVTDDNSSDDDFDKANRKQADFDWRNNKGRPMSQGTLFDAIPAQGPKAPTLTALASTKGESHLVPSILGHIGLESLNRYGVLPIPDESLSKDSAKIVQRLVNHGVIQPHPNNPESLSDNGVGRSSSPNGESRWADNAVWQEGQKINKVRSLGNPHNDELTELDHNIGSQFARQQLVAAKKQREGQ